MIAKLKKLKKIFKSLLKPKQPLFKLIEIDIDNTRAQIQCSGLATLIKISFAELINDTYVLNNLSPKHACWVGYYYMLSKTKSGKNFKQPGLKFQKTNDKFCIISQDRQGELTCLDRHTNKNFKALPLQIAENEELIKFFSPIEACYIGILTELQIRKQPKTAIKPLLTIVK